MAASWLAVPPSPAAADAEDVPPTALAVVEDFRPKDTIDGNLSDAAKDVRHRFTALPGGTLTVTLEPAETEGAAPATGLTLALCDAGGADLGISGGAFDVSKGDGIVRWKKVPLGDGGAFTLVVRAAGAGGFRLTSKSSPGGSKETTAYDDVAADGVAQEVVRCVSRGTLAWSLKAAGKAGFVGEVVRVIQPDGNDHPGVEGGAKGSVAITQDGDHTFVFRNAGTRTGDATATLTALAPKVFARAGFARPTGLALVPVVKKIDPVKAFHKDDALPFRVTGRDLQPGLDIRLLRNGRTDIVGTAVTLVSETEATCVLDLDTEAAEGSNSVGTWTVGVWNAPVYGDAMDPLTLVKDSPTDDRSRTFTSLSSASIRLPAGVVKNTELWHLDFNDAFQTDLDRIGLGSSDPTVRALARQAVEAYVVCYVRDLFRADETDGAVKSGTSVPVSFVVEAPPSVAGAPGEDYNRIEIGGAYQDGDLRDPAEPLLWGFAPVDPGNGLRENLSVEEEMIDETVRTGRGARTRVLDPGGPSIAASFVTATQPLRTAPLQAADAKYFGQSFRPSTQGEANRYRDIVNTVSRTSREVAAIVGHHIGRAMGVPAGGSGPMASPSEAGNMWPLVDSLQFTDGDAADLRGFASPTDVPGVSKELRIVSFPLLSTQPFLLPNATTNTVYAATFGFVGGRPNADSDAYRVQYGAGSSVPLGLTLTYEGLGGTPPLYVNPPNQFYCQLAILRVAVTDRKRETTRTFLYRLNVLPNIGQLPQALQPSATTCRDQILATP
ncbi:MAG: hypothetical protein HMLKMBBP_03902 [Planctomycetes bacterium]|nr:hypothetical protein [Planctomycetota bacterium]